MDYNLLDVIILLGAIQGLISAGLLFFKLKENPTNQYLALILILLSLACLNIYLLETFKGTAFIFRVLAYCLPLIIIMPIGPLVYFYTLAHVDRQVPTFSKAHFYPVILDVLPNLLAICFFIGLGLQFFSLNQLEWLDQFTDLYDKYVDIPRWFFLTGYTTLAYHKLKSNPRGGVQRWPRYFVQGFLIFQVIWLIHLIPYLIPKISDQLLTNFSWYPIYVPLVLLIYWLGINGILQSKSSFFKSPPSQNAANSTLEELRKAMEVDQLYKNTTLRLEHLVEHTNIPQKTISAVLNQTLHKTFNEFVNEYRVEEFKKLLVDPTFEHLTISGLAFESGFNSQATFQRVFKKMMNETPKQYKLRMKNTQI